MEIFVSESLFEKHELQEVFVYSEHKGLVFHLNARMFVSHWHAYFSVSSAIFLTLDVRKPIETFGRELKSVVPRLKTQKKNPIQTTEKPEGTGGAHREDSERSLTR